MRVFKNVLMGACVAITLVTIQPPTYAADKKDIEALFDQVKLNYEVFTLPNGLTALVYPDHKKPEVSIGVYYRVGSKDEPKGKSGFAHLYEHLMFQGTENAPGEYISNMTNIGASNLNGTTNTDRTNYYQTVPTGSLDAALWLESDRMANIVTGITQELLDEQRAVVKNEKRQGELRPQAKILEAITRHLYPVGHPYDHTTIGSMEDLDNATLDDVHQWFKDYYGATNALVVLSGDISIAQAKQKLAHYFSDVDPGQRITKIDESIPILSSNKHVEIYNNTAVTSVMRVWPLPSRSAKDLTLLTYLSSALAGDKESPLVKRLQDKLQYVNNISFSIEPLTVSSIGVLSYDIRKESGVSKEQIEAIIDEELTLFFKHGPNQDILDATFLAADSSLIRALENKGNIANYMLESMLYNDDPEFFKTSRKWEMNASIDDLKAVAQKWLGRPYLELTIKPEPLAYPMNPTVDRSAMPIPQETVAKITFPEFQTATLKNGLKLVVVENKEIPKVDVGFHFKTGSNADHRYTKGTANLAFNLMTMATDKYNENDILIAQKNLAISIMAQSQEFSSLLTFDSLTPYLDESIALAADMIKNPAYPEKGFRLSREATDTSFDNMEQDPSQALDAIQARLFWGGNHPNGKIETRAEAKKAISREQVLKFHKNEIGPNNTTVYMTGDITLAKGKQLLSKHFKEWKKITPTSPRKIQKAQPMKGKVILIDSLGAPSTSIAVGQVLAPYDQSKSEVLSVINGPLGGEFESRLNMNLREDKGWSYGVQSSIAQNPFYEQSLSIETSVQNDKVVSSVIEIIKEIDGYTGQQGITQYELERVKYNGSKTYPSQFSTNASYVESAMQSESYGLPFNYAEGYVERLNNVSLAQARDETKNSIKLDDMFWVIIGDTSLYEEELRRILKDKIEVWDAYGNKLR